MTTHWACADCDATGTTTGTESGADVRHVRATGHTTSTTTTAEYAARWHARVTGQAAVT